MSNIFSLEPSISQMSDEDASDHIGKIRLKRAIGLATAHRLRKDERVLVQLEKDSLPIEIPSAAAKLLKAMKNSTPDEILRVLANAKDKTGSN